MNTPSYTILFVANPTASAELYSSLFGIAPAHASPNFVLFVLPHGYKFALWASADPDARAPSTPGGAMEVGITLDSDEAVDSAFGQWKTRGLPVLMEPTTLPFGRSFVLADPDGHRIRLMAMADQPR